MHFSLDRPNALKYPDGAILEELRRVAALYEHRRFTRHEFDAVASYCKGSVILSRFGTWQAALDSAGLVLVPVKKDRSFISNTALFEEMERVWQNVGHRPSKDEWEAQKPAYSYTTYKTRFHGWLNACAAFIEHFSERDAVTHSSQSFTTKVEPENLPAAQLSPEDRRGVPLKIRYRVLVRDNFRCALCGRSPALDHGVRLHVDHIVPYAHGGKTIEENLRTLCETCNWGKGAEQIEG
ncbi:MAG: HNH endonuclease [Candidatus Nitrotoga sp. MKT]|nr:MAG: HNH endonuclease [Candidatus Nitrotoga sp. MKT]